MRMRKMLPRSQKVPGKDPVKGGVLVENLQEHLQFHHFHLYQSLLGLA
jgi:hypothetical protein